MKNKLTDYTPSEKALYLGRRNHAAKAEFPELILGNRGVGRPKLPGMHEGFVRYEAEQTGWSTRTIKRYLAAYNKLNEATLLRVRRTVLDTLRDLEHLCNLTEEKRITYINRRLAEDQPKRRPRPRKTSINVVAR